MNGTRRKHDKVCGYVVSCIGQHRTWLGAACHGFTDPRNISLLGVRTATIFTSRRAANRAIRQSRKELANTQYEIVPVALMEE